MKKVLGFLLLVVLVLAIVIATRPGTYQIERSMTITAPSEIVFTNLEDFHRWPSWSPWEKLDPNMTRTFSGAPTGVGSQYAWAGNDKVGEGRMTILEARPNQLVAIRLEFLKPWKSTSSTHFTLASQTDETKVTWTMNGTNDWMAKAMGLVMNMDKMIGSDFERGLTNLKTLSEGQAAALPATTDSTTVPATVH
jgi:uncharacterized protein YndB with AHSA1/START domain